ncbi:kinetochore-associated protein KNL-2 homolog [Salvia hispanica]|uniref:kinetochore-associated protein KNL-2 homolog n=1 Tax=Salvia hispanica TaxID=49212 RepID=UPI0020092685|nr:kinetochore-associated protein KNL-2 homolog [Salvia hispanica]XP_047959497.1 kinetochore-associated protein KNL-2 homolog [Salvia hispanica]XP_047959499.1 kinetochore-associated protein KNL-2 homolog [Salvia hispanica]
MGIEGFSTSKWPGLLRQQNTKRGSFSDNKRCGEGKLVQSAEAASRRNSVLLQDWWLIKAGPDTHGKRLGIGGSTLEGNRGIRCFSSAPIVKRHDAVTLETDDGIALMVHGCLNRSRTLENGFSQEICDHFLIGFPYYWEEFAALSDSEDSVYSCASPSDANKTPDRVVRGSNLMSENTNDAILTEASSAKQQKTGVQIQSMDSAGGPLTRSKARLMATKKSRNK